MNRVYHRQIERGFLLQRGGILARRPFRKIFLHVSEAVALLLCSVLLALSAGCAASGAALPPAVAHWDRPSLTVQFSVWYARGGEPLPLQGGLRMARDGGHMGLILLQGRTLGQCLFRDGKLECLPAPPGGARAATMLYDVGRGMARLLAVLEPDGAVSSGAASGPGWSLTWDAPRDGERPEDFRYQEDRGMWMEIRVTEMESR